MWRILLFCQRAIGELSLATGRIGVNGYLRKLKTPFNKQRLLYVKSARFFCMIGSFDAFSLIVYGGMDTERRILRSHNPSFIFPSNAFWRHRPRGRGMDVHFLNGMAISLLRPRKMPTKRTFESEEWCVLGA
jgi:hypothetical protein